MTAPAKPPTLRTGKICYLEIPARDVHQSAWVLGRPPAAEPGPMVYIMVAAGGEIVQPIDP